jgi:4'-phosphopantetheinyl transferase
MSGRSTIWQRPHGPYALPQDEVHVWRASLDQPPDFFARLTQLLSAEERARADKFYFEVDRKRCVLARGLVRLLLGDCLGTPAQQLQFRYNEFGKPSLAQSSLAQSSLADEWRPSVEFNVSHSGDLVLIALSRGRVLGVDIERMRVDVATEEIATRFFSVNECRDLATVAPDLRCAAFFACWTRKEAYLKARGDGLSLPLDKFDVAFLPGQDARLIETRHDPAEAHRWTLHALEGGCGYKAALAVEGTGWKLKCWEWPKGAYDEVAAN